MTQTFESRIGIRRAEMLDELDYLTARAKAGAIREEDRQRVADRMRSLLRLLDDTRIIEAFALERMLTTPET